MIGYVFRQALGDALRFRRVFVWFLVAVLLLGIAKVFLYVNVGQNADSAYSMMSSILVFRLLPLAAAIFSMGVLAQEVEQKTIVYLLTRPIPRWQLLTMRTLAASVVVAGIAWACAISVSIGVHGLQANEYLLRDLKALTVGAFAYTGLFVATSLLINRAMIVCLLFAFGWETLIPNMPGNLFWLSVNSYLTAIAERPSIGGDQGLLKLLATMLGSSSMTTDTAWMAMVLLIAGTLGFGAWWFTGHEYIPREDAE